jgi:hypothetical protein
MKYWSDGTPVAGQQFGYAFDNIGNGTGTQAGGDATGANLRSATYQANMLNQYLSRDVPGAADVMGLSLAPNTVTINGQSNVYWIGQYFRKEISVDNTNPPNAPLWTSISVAATNQSPISGHVVVPHTPEQFQYDADGNLTQDGRWSYGWDSENRLKGVS